jgi:hypothetical protein
VNVQNLLQAGLRMEIIRLEKLFKKGVEPKKPCGIVNIGSKNNMFV